MPAVETAEIKSPAALPSSPLEPSSSNVALDVLDPTTEELSALSSVERAAFHLAHRMNQGTAKRAMTWLQSTLGMGWIRVATYNIMRVYGFEHVEATDHARPIVLASNHRSFFDMYAVSAELYRRTTWRKSLFFPVRARFFYTTPPGSLVNFIMGWFSMYPPIFMTPERRAFDLYSFQRLATLARTGEGHIIGFHPEGTRNKSNDPYSFLPPKTGIGKLAMAVEDIQIIPVFVAGLEQKSLIKQVARNWQRNAEPIRIHFGASIDLSAFRGKRDALRTHKEIADLVMSHIAELAERDRELIHSNIEPMNQ